MKKIITIVGCGAVGAAQLHHLVQQLIHDNIAEHFEILVFEKTSSLAHGVAYALDDHVNLLNRNAETMSLIYHKYDDFMDWLTKNKKKWHVAFPGITISKGKEAFLPRALFGMYCADTIQNAIIYARNHKLKVSIIFDEVMSIDKHNNNYQIGTRNGWKLHSDIVILTLGNLPAQKFGCHLSSEKFYHSPYPTQNLVNISSSASVGILGSRLSAIDAAIALHHRGHKGNMAFISRSGWLPAVRSPYRSHELKILTSRAIQEYVSAKNRDLGLRQIIKLLTKGVNLLCNEKTLISDWLSKPREPKSHFENEFKTYKSMKKIAWQSVLIAFNQVIEQAWNELSDRDKDLFDCEYKSWFMANRVSIPFKNARKIYNLFVSRQLSMIKDFKSISIKSDKFIVQNNSSAFEFDYVIDATGYSDDLNCIQSLLITNMLGKGLIKPHKFGGMDVDFDTSRVIRSDGIPERNLYAIGNLTSGTYFFTSVLELNVKHTYKVAKQIATDFITSCQAHRPVSIANCSPFFEYQNVMSMSE